MRLDENNSGVIIEKVTTILGIDMERGNHPAHCNHCVAGLGLANCMAGCAVDSHSLDIAIFDQDNQISNGSFCS